jgi:hypothetical protein
MMPCALVISSVFALAGCAAGAAGSQPPTAPPPTPTSQVGFAVAVSTVPTRLKPRDAAHPRPTLFVAPKGPYLRLIPNTGPPQSQAIEVRGAHLPKAVQIDLVWAPGRHASALVTTAQTDGRGSLTAYFTVPATRPGFYRIEARLGKARIAWTRYHVVVRALMSASVTPTATGERLRVTGRHFMPGARLLLALYPMISGARPTTLGVVRSSDSGGMSFEKVARKLVPGEYVLRAWSLDFVTVDLADAYFQVVV